MAKKGNCPGCGARMKLRSRYCGQCGKGNPLMSARTVRRRAPVSKSAGTGYAPVVTLPLGVIRESGLASYVYSECDPGKRESYINMIVKSARHGGDAA